MFRNIAGELRNAGQELLLLISGDTDVSNVGVRWEAGWESGWDRGLEGGAWMDGGWDGGRSMHGGWVAGGCIYGGLGRFCMGGCEARSAAVAAGVWVWQAHWGQLCWMDSRGK